jgi:hypothetical protein
MDEPSDIPSGACRPWTYLNTDLESHGGSPISVIIQYLGQTSFVSQGWEEYVTDSGRQVLRSNYPGKPSGCFILLCGGKRTSPNRQNWPVKVSGRILTVLLCGGGIQKTPAEFAALGLSDADCLDPAEFEVAAPYTEAESTIGSRANAMTIPESYDPATRVGKWEKIVTSDGGVLYQR